MVLLKEKVNCFFETLKVEGGGICSVPSGVGTLYGAVYSFLTAEYLGVLRTAPSHIVEFIQSCQLPDSGLIIGPELKGYTPAPSVQHDLEHLSLHSTCTVLPFCQDHSISLQPIVWAHQLCDLEFLKQWLSSREWKNAWFEGNNILFAGQLLVYLRDVEKRPDAQLALDFWFEWLDSEVDPLTSLWGSDGFCSNAEAVYGGYHQLLLYWYENRQIVNPAGLVDTILDLQHLDGGFNRRGNGGACEDVDCVDILVNCYKRYDYRRADVRLALRHCKRHIFKTQNPDGGFPYNRNQPQSHMGIPGTEADPNVSCAFPTWFRVHTLALIAEVLPEEPEFKGVKFAFSQSLGMGWHTSPEAWDPAKVRFSLNADLRAHVQLGVKCSLVFLSRVKRYAARRVKGGK